MAMMTWEARETFPGFGALPELVAPVWYLNDLRGYDPAILERLAGSCIPDGAIAGPAGRSEQLRGQGTTPLRERQKALEAELIDEGAARTQHRLRARPCMRSPLLAPA
jgi:hypothetical protein